MGAVYRGGIIDIGGRPKKMRKNCGKLRKIAKKLRKIAIFFSCDVAKGLSRISKLCFSGCRNFQKIFNIPVLAKSQCIITIVCSSMHADSRFFTHMCAWEQRDGIQITIRIKNHVKLVLRMWPVSVPPSRDMIHRENWNVKKIAKSQDCEKKLWKNCEKLQNCKNCKIAKNCNKLWYQFLQLLLWESVAHS